MKSNRHGQANAHEPKASITFFAPRALKKQLADDARAQCRSLSRHLTFLLNHVVTEAEEA